MNKFLLTHIFFLLLFNATSAQNTSRNVVCSVDSLPADFFKKDIFVFGEFHYKELTTMQYKLELINKLIQLGKKQVYIFFEDPPSGVYFLNKYYNTGDTELLKNPYLVYYLPFINALRKYPKTIKFKLIGINLQSVEDKLGSHIFFQYLIDKIPLAIYNKSVLRLYNSFSAHAMKRAAIQITNDPEALLVFKKSLDSIDYQYFNQEIKMISQYGFVLSPRTKNGFELRNRYMAIIINKGIKDTIPGIVTVGMLHIVPRKGEKYSQLIELIKNHSSKSIVLLPIIYKDDYFLDVGTRFYYKKSEFEKAVVDGIYDAVLIPCD